MLEISFENIKEISIVTDYVFMGYNKDYYSDLLRISKNWVSYRRANYHTGEEMCSWSYRTSSDVLHRKFDSICSCLYHEYHCPHEHNFITDSGNFNIRITFVDGTHIDLSYLGDFAFNGLSYHALQFLKIIPELDEYPHLMNVFNTQPLTKEILGEINKEKLSALMYAEGGAMGSPGHIEIVTDDYSRYVAETMFDKDCEVNQFEVTSLFDGFEPNGGFDSSNVVRLNGVVWHYINLGFGNHLYLNDRFYRDLGSLIEDLEPSIAYRKWSWLFCRRDFE